MKVTETTNIQRQAAQFEELCSLLGSIQSVVSETSYAQATSQVAQVESSLAEMRMELSIASSFWLASGEYLVGNDHYVVSRMVERGAVLVIPYLNERARIRELHLKGNLMHLDELMLLPELRKIQIGAFRYEEEDQWNCNLEPLVKCPQIMSLLFYHVDSQMEMIESVLKKMPWLESVKASGKQKMNLDWATSHPKLRSLAVLALKIGDITPLSNCLELRALTVAYNPIRSLASLKALDKLSVLDIRDTDVPDLWDVLKLNGINKLTLSPTMTALPGFTECKEMIESRGGTLKVWV